MSNPYTNFYQSVVSPLDESRSKDLIEMLLTEKAWENTESYLKKVDSSNCDLAIKEALFKKCIHYINGKCHVLKNDSVRCKLENTGEVEHTFFLNLLKGDLYTFLNDYITICNEEEIPFEVRLDEVNGIINIYATNETLLVTRDVLLEVIRQNPNIKEFRTPVLAGIISSCLGYVNEAYNRGGKPFNRLENTLKEIIDEAFLEALKSLYTHNRDLNLNVSGRMIKWKDVLSYDITKKIYEQYYPTNDSEFARLNSIFAPQYFGVSSETFLDEQFIYTLHGYISEGLDDLFEKGIDIKLPNSVHPVLKAKNVREIMVRNALPNSPINLCNTRVLNLPFEKAVSRRCQNLDPENPCFKRETRDVFETLDSKVQEEVPIARTMESGNEEYIYYAFFIKNNKSHLVNFKGRDISFGDYFVRYASSYISGHTEDKYEDIYSFLKDKIDLLIEDIRNYGSENEKGILSDEDIEFLIEKLSRVIAKAFPGKEYKKRSEVVLH